MPRFIELPDRKAEAKRLYKVRETLGLSQREMADELGVTPAAITQWESGSRTLPGPVLRLISIYEAELTPHEPGEAEGYNLSSSWGARSLSLSALSAAVSAQWATSFVETLLRDKSCSGLIQARVQMAIARRITDKLGDMKGFAMKVGQMISYLDFAMPESSRRIYASLEKTASPMPAGVVARVFHEEFGKSPHELFAEWSERPFAIASIGQVHYATLHSGERVVVKVQYPRIVEALEADLRNVAGLDRLFSLVMPDHIGQSLVSELRDRFSEECDYLIEAQNQTEIREHFSARPGILVPKVYQEFSSRRVLTTERVEGLSFEGFLRTASQEQKNRAGELIWQFSFESIFKHGIFNCDPHPGNYLFLDQGVAFLDFGCCKRFDKKLVGLLADFIRSILEGDLEASKRGTIAMGHAKDPREFDYVAYVEVMEVLFEPWFYDHPTTFRKQYVIDTWDRMMTEKNPNRHRTTLGKDWILINRLQWGVGAILARLEATSHWRQRILDLLYAKGKPRPMPRKIRKPGSYLSEEAVPKVSAPSSKM